MNLNKAKNMQTLVVIPARMASQRLPGKPLADIGGVPMIVHVLQRALAANVGLVVVACAETQVAQAVRAAGGTAVMTDADLPSGTDRVKAAADSVDPERKYDCVINVQGDLPTLDPLCVSAVVDVLRDTPSCDISTLVVETENAREIADPNVVKAVLSMQDEQQDQKQDQKQGRALYFTRASVPTGHGLVWHHVGIYGYRRCVLDRFCALAPSPLEIRERLEQLRALEAGMRIDARVIESEPHGVDTPEDLARARHIILRTNS